MTIVTVRTFTGLQPKRASRRTDEPYAQVADWSRLDNRQLRPWRDPVKIMGLCGNVDDGDGGGGGLYNPNLQHGAPELWKTFPYSYSCLFTFDDVETSPGVWEQWVTWDDGDTNVQTPDFYIPLRITRLNRDTGEVIGQLTLGDQVNAEYTWGGVKSIVTDTHVWYLGTLQIISVSKTSPFTHTIYTTGLQDSDPGGIADPYNKVFWVFSGYPYTTLAEWSIATTGFTGRTVDISHPTWPTPYTQADIDYERIEFGASTVAPDGTFWFAKTDWWDAGNGNLQADRTVLWRVGADLSVTHTFVPYIHYVAPAGWYRTGYYSVLLAENSVWLRDNYGFTEVDPNTLTVLNQYDLRDYGPGVEQAEIYNQLVMQLVYNPYRRCFYYFRQQQNVVFDFTDQSLLVYEFSLVTKTGTLLGEINNVAVPEFFQSVGPDGSFYMHTYYWPNGQSTYGVSGYTVFKFPVIGA